MRTSDALPWGLVFSQFDEPPPYAEPAYFCQDGLCMSVANGFVSVFGKILPRIIILEVPCARAFKEFVSKFTNV